MTNTTYPFYGINDEEEITFYDIEKWVKKMNQNHLKIIRIKYGIINAIIEKKIGGNKRSWEPKEYEEFIKLKNSYNNRIIIYEFLTSLSTTIPYITVSELYEKFLIINDIQKLLLNKYKEIKQKKEKEEKNSKIKIRKEKQEKLKKYALNNQKIQEESRQKK